MTLWLLSQTHTQLHPFPEYAVCFFFLETLQHNNGDARMETSLDNAFLQTSFAITVKSWEIKSVKV